MHIFKAIGIVTNSLVQVLTKGLKTLENIADMGESMTNSMLEETKAESKIAMRELEEKYQFLKEDMKE